MTVASILEKALAMSGPTSNQCSVCVLLADKKIGPEVQSALDDYRVSLKALHSVLKDAGHQAGREKLSQHRKGLCGAKKS